MKVQTDKSRKLLLLFTSIISLTGFNTAAAGTINTTQNINSVAQVKNELRDTIKVWDNAETCAGACLVSRELHICNLVENLDTRVGGKISRRNIQRQSSSSLRIDQSDLKFMRLIYSQCKSVKEEDLPPYIQHNANRKYKSFEPSCNSLAIIREGLGINPNLGVHCN
ncbi:hypothetical protein [Calothrix sp. PCC 7507]|uniref:hypothetical protein n=1 Tax=Calothrix sp. PCC 7507 TaxID=99598 RepID=UPI00029F4054|nr:hypothetical protein [Calothrix sp. PCC 7507]AFY31828.1 hypothetical protein Cal7507_1361 [Calothrix sp. PCC 7507]